MDGELLYFAYGSNMSIRRLRQRARSASFVTVAMLAGHQLRFHKVGQDRSAKCDAYETGDEGDTVFGVVFDVQIEDKVILDIIEGLGRGYWEKLVELQIPAGGDILATLYCATDIDPALKPFSWYKHHVLFGATQCGLPDVYVEQSIRQIESIDDSDCLRQRREMAVYAP